MKRWFMIVGLGAMVTVGVHEAFAGFKENNPVQVDLPSRTAAGSIGATRRTTDNVQYIGCTVAGDQNGNTVSCFARTANSTSLFCQTTSPFLVQAAAALSGDAYLSFSVDVSGRCNRLLVNQDSSNDVKSH